MGATMTTDPEIVLVLGAGSSVEEREARLLEGAEGLAVARDSILSHPRLLIAAAAALMTAGISAVVLGWIGAAHSTLLEEQVPYLISGGLLGVALSTIGALLFFTHWLTVAIKDARNHEAARRQDHEELLEALRGLGGALAGTGDTDGNARGPQPGRPVRRPPRRS